MRSHLIRTTPPHFEHPEHTHTHCLLCIHKHSNMLEMHRWQICKRLRPLNQNDESKRESLVCLTSTGCLVISNPDNLGRKAEFIQNHLSFQTLLPKTLVSPSRAPSSKLTAAIKEEHLTVHTHRHLSHDGCFSSAKRFLL